MIEVHVVEECALNFEDADDVGPLSVGDFVSESEPDELVQENVFGAGKPDRDLTFRGIEVFLSGTRHLFA